MSIEFFILFFLWVTILSFGLLLVITTIILLFKKPIYRMQSRLFDISEHQFEMVIYCFLASFKLLAIFFGLVPLLAVWIIG